MIAFDQEQHLGIKALILISLRRVMIGFIFIVIGLVLVAFHDTLFHGALQMVGTNGAINASSSFAVEALINKVTAAAFLLGICLFVCGSIIALLEYSNYTYTIQEFDLKVKKGILYKEEVSIPYRSMQDVNIVRGIFYLLLGMCRMLIDSAGNEKYEEHNETHITLEPIDIDVGKELRTILQRKIGVQIIETEKQADAEAKAGDPA